MTTEKNSVFVELYDMPLSEREDDRFGRVVTSRSVTEDELIDIAVRRRTDLNRSTLRAAIDILKDIAMELLANGASVQFGLGFFSLEVKGVFVGDHASWDSARHSLRVKVRASAEVRRLIAKVHASVIGRSRSEVTVNAVIDISSREINGRITPGGGLNITGVKLKIAGEKAGNGISLVNQSDGSVWEIGQSSIIANEPSLITVIVPAELPAGDYKLSITTQYSCSSKVRRNARTYVLEHLLTVD